MVNEYRESLNEFDEINRRWDELRLRKEIAPEEEFLVFFTELDKYWPHMYALEQQVRFRKINQECAAIVNSVYRLPSGRKNAYGTGEAYIGIFGQHRPANHGAVARLDHKMHEGKQVLGLRDVRELADAVDKCETQK